MEAIYFMPPENNQGQTHDYVPEDCNYVIKKLDTNEIYRNGKAWERANNKIKPN